MFNTFHFFLMSLLANALRQTLPRVPDRLEQLSALIDPTWIAQALGTSGKASIRRRKQIGRAHV